MDRIPKLLSQYLPADLHQPLHIGIRHTRGSLAARRLLRFISQRCGRGDCGLGCLRRRRGCRRWLSCLRRRWLDRRRCRRSSNHLRRRHLRALLCGAHRKRLCLLLRRGRFPCDPCPNSSRSDRRHKPARPPAQPCAAVRGNTRKFRTSEHKFQVACEIILSRECIFCTRQPRARRAN